MKKRRGGRGGEVGVAHVSESKRRDRRGGAWPRGRGMSALRGVSASQSLAACPGDRKVGTRAGLGGCVVTRIGAPLLCWPCVNSPAARNETFSILAGAISDVVFPPDSIK